MQSAKKAFTPLTNERNAVLDNVSSCEHLQKMPFTRPSQHSPINTSCERVITSNMRHSHTHSQPFITSWTLFLAVVNTVNVFLRVG
jgi:hypothetical protein